MLAGWLGGSWDKEMSKSDLKQGLWETPTGESGIVCVCWEGCGGTGGGGVDGREKSWMFGCVVRAEAQQQALRTPNTRTSTHKEMTHKPHPSRPVLATFTHTHTEYAHTSVSLLRFHRSRRPMPSTAANMAGCTGDHMTSYT